MAILEETIAKEKVLTPKEFLKEVLASGIRTPEESAKLGGESR
jgi:hypothetical protein